MAVNHKYRGQSRSMNLLRRLQTDYPQLKFVEGERYLWRPQRQEIHYQRPLDHVQLLHELGHAIHNHQTYQLGIELLQMEAEAWQAARKLGRKYNLNIDSTQIDVHLNSYRSWLHQRLRCPTCHLVGLETDPGLDHSCPNCYQKWRVPDHPQCVVTATPL